MVEQEGENLDYSRCDTVILCCCVPGRDERATGVQREEKQQGQQGGEKTIFLHTSHLVISPEKAGELWQGKDLLVVENVSRARCSFLFPFQRLEKTELFHHAKKAIVQLFRKHVGMVKCSPALQGVEGLHNYLMISYCAIFTLSSGSSCACSFSACCLPWGSASQAGTNQCQHFQVCRG